MPSVLVSVIVPTFRRPTLVLRAVHSALTQTYGHLEVVVIVDGPHPATEAALRTIDDPRLRFEVLPHSVGAAAARNAGATSARGELIGFLDDDDEWLPDKLATQVPLAVRGSELWPVVSCRFVVRTDSADRNWPLRLPDPGENLSEYLFCQRGLRGGEGMLLTSTLLVRKELARRVPWTAGVVRYNDVDWLLRLARTEGFGVVFPESDRPGVIYHFERGRNSLSESGNWRKGLRFARDRRHLFTKRSYAAFLLTSVAQTAASEYRPWALPVLSWEAVRFGRPRLLDFLTHLSIWLIPRDLRTRLTATRPRAKAAMIVSV